MTKGLYYCGPSCEGRDVKHDYRAHGFESDPHRHVGRLSKHELALHLTLPHKTKTGWSSMATPVSAIRKWRRDEMDRTHAEFHS